MPGRRRVQREQQLIEEPGLGRMMRHQHHDHGPALNSGDVIELSHGLPIEFPDQHRLAHPAFAHQQDVLHALARRLHERLMQVAEDTFRRSVLHPPFGPDVRDPRLRIERGDRPHVLREMRELGHRHHQNSTPLVSPS